MPPLTSPEQATPNDKTTKAAKLLAENVTRLMNSDTFKEALKFRTKFYRYSFNNSFLIYIQCPEATYVAGYRKWQQLGRQVRKGEKAISILAPIIKKVEEEGKEEKRPVGFRTASVFDLSQTDGDELPELPQPERLTEDSDAIRTTIQRLETYATEQGFPVQRKAIEGSALGKFSLTSKTITLRDDLEPLQELKTLTHELAPRPDAPGHLSAIRQEAPVRTRG